MLHLLALPFVLFGVLMSGIMAATGVALFAVFLIPFLLLAVFFRASFFFLKVIAVFTLGALLLTACL
jgi:hypothetical protein